MRIAALLVVLSSMDAVASSAIAMDVPALTAASSEVVRARVTSARAEWSGDHRRIVTHLSIDVLDTWKGHATAQLTVLQPGGERDGLTQLVPGVATLAPGEEVVLFLARTGPYYRVVGLAQGVYRVSSESSPRALPASVEDLELVAPAGRTPGPRVPVALDRLRAQVEAAR
jgi:hypothetical protein